MNIQIIAALLTAISPATLVALAIAEPSIGKTLSLPDREVLLISEVFIFSTLCVTLLTGSLLSRFGARRVLLLSSGVYLATVAVAFIIEFFLLSMSLQLLYGFVFFIGLATAPLAPATQSLLIRSMGPTEYGRAMALWTMAKTTGFLISALVAGWLIERFGWQSQFFIGVIPALLALPFLLLARQLSEPRAAGNTFDWRGLLLMMGWLIPLQMILNAGGGQHGHWAWVIAAGVVVVIGLLGYARHALRTTDPVLDISPLGQMIFIAVIAAIVVVNITTTGQFEILYLGGVLDYPTHWLSYRSTLGGLSQVVGAVIGGYLVQHKQLYRGTLAGLLITAAGLASYTLYGEGQSLFTLIWPRIIAGVGAGMLFPLLASAAYATLQGRKIESAASILVFATLLGTESGIELLGLRLEDTATPSSLIIQQDYMAIFWLQAILTLGCLWVLTVIRDVKPANQL